MITFVSQHLQYTPPQKHHQGKKKVHGVWLVDPESTTIELSKKGKIKIFVR